MSLLFSVLVSSLVLYHGTFLYSRTTYLILAVRPLSPTNLRFRIYKETVRPNLVCM